MGGSKWCGILNRTGVLRGGKRTAGCLTRPAPFPVLLFLLATSEVSLVTIGTNRLIAGARSRVRCFLLR